jgi:3D-(3,5/4)-trihydroxycyclohexane-1,2-dione acylhydrolase (decyclizing)
VRFVNVNVADFDAAKLHGIALVADARVALERLTAALHDHRVEPEYRELAARLNRAWDEEVTRLYGLDHEPLPAQSEVIGAVNEAARPADVVVCAAGSMPGDLHKLWRTRDPKGYHVEYGYSCMGYEIAGGLGVKLAAPEREVYVMVGDGSYLMLSSEIVTSIQEGLKLTIVLVDNHGFSSIGSLSRSLGTDGFGTQYRYRRQGSLGVDSDSPTAPLLPVDLATNAESLGAKVIRCRTIAELRDGLVAAKGEDSTVVLSIEVDRYEGVPRYGSGWDVPVAEISEVDAVKAARAAYEQARTSIH